MKEESELEEGSALKERVKELSCLYEISAIGGMFHAEPYVALERIVHRIPLAWMYSEHAIAEIRVDGDTYTSGTVPMESSSQSAQIIINQSVRGTVSMYYGLNSETHFLEEEQRLIEMIAQEISVIVERAELRAKEREFEQKMRRSDRLNILGEITAGIAHELNTPLANVLGFSQFIRDNTNEVQSRKDAEKIIQSTIHAREVVKKLMLFSCDVPIEIEESNVNEIVASALKLLQPTIKEADLDVTLEKDPDDTVAKIDALQITQLVFNLVINAVHASKPNGSICVRLYSSEIDLGIEVEDDGYGISEEVQSKMFEPFYSTKQPGEGSGLGLSVVHGIVKSHRGSIDVESKVGKGSRFVIRIPLER